MIQGRKPIYKISKKQHFSEKTLEPITRFL